MSTDPSSNLRTNSARRIADKAIPQLYQIGLLLAVVAMPFSNLGMSISGFWLSGTWIIDQIFCDAKTRRYRWAKAVGNPVFWLLSGLFLIHLFGLVHTRDWAYALRDLRIKLPLLLFTLIFFTARPIEGRTFRRMLTAFVLATSAAAVYCLMIPLGVIEREVNNIREISIFISHIRFGMLLAFASAILLLWLSAKKMIVLSVALLAINLTFLWVIESITGALLLCAIVLLYLVSTEVGVLGKRFRRVIRIAIPALLIIAGVKIYFLADDYFSMPDDFIEQLPQTTAAGTPYQHHIGSKLKENGHFIYYSIARSELDTSWAHRSNLDLNDLDARGHKVYNTLLRYMTSKGLAKDAEGLSQLTNEEIAHIESGVASVLEFEHKGLRRRLDKILFEVALMQSGGNPSGNSVTQRFEFWRAAWHIVQKNPIFGVGTGDVKEEMSSAYIDIDTRLYEEFRLRAHNQYLTFWVAFGIFGVLLLLATLFFGFRLPRSERGFLMTAFFAIIALSYLTEDTLETQAGVTFVAFFSALFAAQRLAFHARLRG